MDFKSFQNFIDILELIKLEAKYTDGIQIINKNIDQFNSEEQLAELYCYLGMFYAGLDDENQALNWFNKITEDKSKQQYARSLINVGILFFQKEKYNDAINKWNLVKEEYSVKEYQRVKYWKAMYCYDIEKNEKEAINLMDNINAIDYPKYYALANIALSYYYKGNSRKNISLLKKIKRIHDSSIYAEAQVRLFFKTKDKIYLQNIRLEDSEEDYSFANYILGFMTVNLEEKKEFWNKIIESSQFFHKNRYEIKLLKKISKLNNEEPIIIGLLKILDKVETILKYLFISSDYEKLIAHYTNITVSKLLLSRDDNAVNFKTKSLLRLNTINLMNDPEEGLLVNKILDLDSEITTDDLAFIACFTLHHDSLNQFRLYSKEDKNEASGLSLILGRDFFSQSHSVESINDVGNSREIGLDEKKKVLSTNKLAAMPLYRCIYFDPSSGLLKVAQREKWSFWREFKSESIDHLWYEKNEEAEKKWEAYIHGTDNKDGIKNIEERVKQCLEELSKLVEELKPINMPYEEQELLAEILLPLRYLIKHMAFKEEQECRIVYVTSMDNSLIQYDGEINRIYIDYEPLVMEHLEKIYLAPKAKDEKIVFDYLCSRGMDVRQNKIIDLSDGKVKVKISQNPFR